MNAATGSITCIAGDAVQLAVREAYASHDWRGESPELGLAAGGIAEAMALYSAEPIPGLLALEVDDVLKDFAELQGLCRACAPATRVVVIGAINDVERYRAAMAAGASDYLVAPLSAEAFRAALTRAAAAGDRRTSPSRDVASAAKQARRIAVVGARGGVGTSSLVLGCGWILAKELGRKTCIVDLDLHFGTLPLLLDLEAGRGLREGLERPDRVDALLLATAVTNAGDGLSIVSAEEPVEDAIAVGARGIEAFTAALQNSAEIIIYEISRRLGEADRGVLANADVAVIVTDLSLAGLRDALRLSLLIRTLGRGKPLVVASQAGSPHRGELARKEFEKQLGAALAAAIPFDAAAAKSAAEAAKPMPSAAARGPAAAAMRRLAALLDAPQAGAAGMPSKGARAAKSASSAPKRSLWKWLKPR